MCYIECLDDITSRWQLVSSCYTCTRTPYELFSIMIVILLMDLISTLDIEIEMVWKRGRRFTWVLVFFCIVNDASCPTWVLVLTSFVSYPESLFSASVLRGDSRLYVHLLSYSCECVQYVSGSQVLMTILYQMRYILI